MVTPKRGKVKDGKKGKREKDVISRNIHGGYFVLFVRHLRKSRLATAAFLEYLLILE